jgi:hypothetical protein
VGQEAFENWLVHGWGIQVETPHQLLHLISQIAMLGNDRIYAWRGQNDAAYDFSSSLYRRLGTNGNVVTEELMRVRRVGNC